MIPIPPEQTQALRAVLSQAAPKVAAVLGCSEEDANQFLKAAAQFVEATGGAAPDQRFVLSFQPGGTGGTSLTPVGLRKHLRDGNHFLSMNSNFRLVGQSSDSILLSAASERTETRRSFEIVVYGTYLHYVLAGRIIDEGQVRVVSPSARPSSQWRRPFADIQELLRDHVENFIAREQGTVYWADKSARILLTGRDGTESIFQLALFWWLRNYVSDSVDVYAEPTKHGQDKTDVVVVTVDGKFMIEVKWLGKNESHTVYAEGRIQEGLEQVAIYLTNDTKIVWAHLVIYDARVLAQHQANRSYAATCKHSRCSEPNLIFLESDTPTQAVKKQRQRKKKA